MRPIFFAWTRSFWFAVAGAAIALGQAPPEVVNALAWIAAQALPWPQEAIAEALPHVLTVLAFAGVIWTRSGSARPYTTALRKETLQ